MHRPTLQMRFLTPTEILTLANAIDERYRAFVVVGAYCGLRLGELAGLRRHRVDLLHRHVQVVAQLGRDETGHWALQPVKTSASRRESHCPPSLSARSTTTFRRWSGRGREGFVFTAPDGGHIDPDNFRSRIWIPAVSGAGLTPLRIHDLRHTTASLAIAGGADIKTLQSMLGHASAVMTLDRYGHLVPGRSEEVADRLDVLARSATVEPTPAPVPLDARDISGIALEPPRRTQTEKRR